MKFSFSWLNSAERKELEALKTEKLRDEIRNEMFVEQIKDIPVTYFNQNPYRSLRLINELVLVVLQDGTTLSKSDGGVGLLNKVKAASSEEEILLLFVPEQKIAVETDKFETDEERELVRRNWKVLENHPDFEVRDNEAYIKGVNMPLPAMIAAEFIRICEQLEDARDYTFLRIDELQDEYTALRMFTLKLALNPIQSSREDALRFVKEYDIKITAFGNLIMYRGIVSVGKGDKALSQFISTEYFKVKKWKKSPANYNVWYNTEKYFIEKTDKDSADIGGIEIMGNLADLYANLDNVEENRYTDAHTGTMDIRVGTVYSLPEEDIDIDSRQSCSAGLHVGNAQFGIGSFGDTKVLCLVNPAKIRSIPYSDSNKMRVSEMFIAAVLEEDRHGYMDYDVDILHFDEDYHAYSVEELTEALQGCVYDFADSISCQDEIAPLSKVDVQAITDMLIMKVTNI